MLVRDKFFINGRWVAPAGRRTIHVINASTEQVMGSVPEGDAADADAAVRAARAAFEGWAALPVAQRAEYLGKIQEGLQARSEELAKVIAVDGAALTGFGEDLRAVVRKRMEDMKAAHAAKK